MGSLLRMTGLVQRAAATVIKDLNVTNMLANRHLARAIADFGFFAFRRQLEYETAMTGVLVVVADRWFASSNLCSTCGWKHEALMLSERIWTCVSCGTSHERDVNAAVNLARYRTGDQRQLMEPKALAAGISPPRNRRHSSRQKCPYISQR